MTRGLCVPLFPTAIIAAVVVAALTVPPARTAAQLDDALLTRASTPALLRGCALAARWRSTRWTPPLPAVGPPAASSVGQDIFDECQAGGLPVSALGDSGSEAERAARYADWGDRLDHDLAVVSRLDDACSALPPAWTVESTIVAAWAVPAEDQDAAASRLEEARVLVSWCYGGPHPVPDERLAGELEDIALLAMGSPSASEWSRRMALAEGLEGAAALTSDPPEPDGGEGRTGRARSFLGDEGTAEEFALLILEGLADFLVSRAEQEIQTFVVVRIREELCTPDEGDISNRTAEYYAERFLRNTCAFLGGPDFTFGTVLGAGFRSAVVADVLAVPTTALDVTRCESPTTLPTCAAVQGDDVPVMVLRLGLRVVELMLRGSDPRTVLDGVLAHLVEDGLVCTELTALVHGIGSVLAASQLEGRTINAEDLIRMIEAAHPNHGYDTSRLAQHVLQWVETLRRVREATSRTGEDAAAPGVALRIASEVVQSGLLVVTDLLEMSNLDLTLPAWVGPTLQAFLTADPARIVAASLRLIQELASSSGVAPPAAVVRLVGLGAELAVAEDREAVSEILDQFAAPVGSWRAKNDHLVVSVGGLLGLSGGGEYIFASGERTGSLGGYGGLVGLVGLDLAGPLRRGGPNLGAFFSVLDVGALVTIGSASPSRCVSATGEEVPAMGENCPSDTTTTTPVNTDVVSPLQFVAPGLFLRLGLPELPFVLGLGMSVQPWGRTIYWGEGEDQRSEMIPVLRFGAFIAVDITILPL